MKSNRLLLSALALAVSTPVIVLPIETSAVETTKDIKDVPKSNPNYEIIMEMIEKGIISGYEDGTFRPSEPITRKHASILLNRQLDLPEVSRETKMKDLPKTSTYYDAMSKVVSEGFLKVNPNGLIFPDRPLTRGEMAQVLARAFELDLKGEMHPFTDVRDWNNMYVSALYNSGITTGYTDGTYREDEVVTREHFAVFMYRTMKFVEPVNLDTLTDEEIFSMSNRQLSNYIKSYQYKNHGYLPEGQTDVSENHNKWSKVQQNYNVGEYPLYLNNINNMSKDDLDRQHTGDIGEILRNLSENVFGLSAKETIDLLNEAFLKGSFITDEDIPTAKRKFSMFYNYGASNLFIEAGDLKI